MLRRWLYVTALLWLAGCASLPETGPVTEESHALWAKRQTQLDSFNQWHIQGRAALFINDEVYNLSLFWDYTPQQELLRMEASLGQGLVEIQRNQDSVTLTDVEGNQFTGHSIEQLLYRASGWQIPVSGLGTWIKGINHHSSDYLPDIDALGRAKSLQQDDWRINYFDYSTQTLHDDLELALPHKLYMKHPQLALKIVIDSWQAQSEKTDPEDSLFPRFD